MAVIDLFGAATDYLEEQTLRRRFNLSPGLAFGNRYLALAMYDSGAGYTTGWAEDGTGGVEPDVSDGYDRVLLPGTNWAAPALGLRGSLYTGLPDSWYYWYSVYTQEIAFPVPTADWGTAEPAGFGIFDTATPGTGNCLVSFAGQRVSPGTSGPPNASSQLVFLANQIRFGYPRSPYVYPFSTYGTTYDTHYWSDDSVKAIINHVVGRTALTPATLYLGLWGHASFGDPDTEPADPAYSRRILDASALTLGTDGAGYRARNTNDITWSPVGTGLHNQWRGRWLSLWDAATGGNQVLNGPGTTNLGSAVADGDTIKIAADSQVWKFF